MKNTTRKPLSVFSLFIPEVKELLERKDFIGIRNLTKTINSMDLAEGWGKLEPTSKIIIFKLLSAKKSVELFENLPFEEQTHILNNLDNQEVAQVINSMAPDERADLFKELPPKAIRKLFLLINKEHATNVRELIDFKEDTAGSLMTTEFVKLRKEMTAKQAILHIQGNLRTNYRENVYSVFITDENSRLIGVISLQDLVKAPPDIAIKEIMTRAELIKIDAGTDANDVSLLFKKYDLFDAPVVDKENTLIGIITVDDIVERIEKEATKEFYEIGKMSPENGEIISYNQASTFDLIKRRCGWLIMLLVFDFLTGTVLKNFEATLSSIVALAFFIPMLLDTGGNAGAQTSITIIRGLATGDVNIKNVMRVIRLEFKAAFFMGLIVGVVAFGRAFLLQKDFTLAIVVGLTMVLIAILAISTGVFLPLFSKKIGLDPAVLAGPITTSVVDVGGLIIYFKIAQMLIPGLR